MKDTGALTLRQQKRRGRGKLILKNALLFLFHIGFVYLYQLLFGAENILPGVAVAVAITMYPGMEIGLKPLPMVLITVVLLTGSGLTAQLALNSPWVALPVNFLFTAAVMLLICEPAGSKTYICFVLCFVFCQATPVPWERFPFRFVCLLAGGIAAALATVIWWKKKGYGKNGRSLPEQIRLCAKNRGLVLRMAAGLALAMLTGMLLHLKKPLWISIVVMSLTQLEFSETFLRIRHRTAATVAGIAVFLVVFRMLVPSEYAILVIFALSYATFFTPEYKYKQVVNAICALNASMILLDPGEAVFTRVLCLLAGVGIVLLLVACNCWIKKRRSRERAGGQQQGLSEAQDGV